MQRAWPVKARIEKAAVELFTKHPVGSVTAASIASRAGVTERTFFRYFPNKLDAFFGEEQAHLETVLFNVQDGHASALDAAVRALQPLAVKFSLRRSSVIARSEVIAANRELREREAARGGVWSASMAAALRKAGYEEEPELAASLALAIFRRAYELWLTKPAMRLEDVFTEVTSAAAKLVSPRVKRRLL